MQHLTAGVPNPAVLGLQKRTRRRLTDMYGLITGNGPRKVVTLLWKANVMSVHECTLARMGCCGTNERSMGEMHGSEA